MYKITYHGISLAVTGEYFPPVRARLTADPYYSTPPEGDYFEIWEVMANGRCITPAISVDALEEIEMIVKEDFFS